MLAATGHSPKRLARIGRMQAMLAAGRGESWARTAVDFGFHDESHMINDIRALANATPQSMLSVLSAARETPPPAGVSEDQRTRAKPSPCTSSGGTSA